VSKILGYADDSMIRRLISSKKLNATKVGKTWVIDEKALKGMKRQRQQYRKRTAKK
jgi:hypothetical protein